MKNSEKTLDMIVGLCKNRGYVYAGSEIYGGLANSWATTCATPARRSWSPRISI